MSMVFISTAMTQPESLKPMWHSFRESQSDFAIETRARNDAGESLGPEFFPEDVWAAPDATEREYGQLPQLFFAGSFWVVSAKAAAVLQAHDLGAGALYPVNVYGKDRQTPLGDGWFCLNFGNQKRALLADQCTYIRPASGGGWRNMASLKDDEFAVSKAALAGPDIWVDPDLRNSLFFSEPLGKALKKAKAAHGFYLRSCRVID